MKHRFESHLLFLVDDVHHLHGHLIADVAVFGPVVTSQGDIHEIHPPGLHISLQKLQEADLGDAYWTQSIVQHLAQQRSRLCKTSFPHSNPRWTINVLPGAGKAALE